MSDSEDEQEAQQPEDPADGSSSESDNSAARAGVLSKVWDGGKLIQTTDAQGNKIMRCLHGNCGRKWKKWNHTKALGHVIGGCTDIQQCKFVSQRWREKYEAIRFGAVQRKQDKLNAIVELNMGMDELEARVRQQQAGAAASAAFPAPRARASQVSQAASYSTIPSSSDEGGGMVCLGVRHSSSTPTHSAGTKRALADVFRHKLGSTTSSKKKNKFFHQTSLVTSIGKNVAHATDALDVAIAHMILACNLPFSLVEDELFKRMLIRARDVNANYTPPTAFAVSGCLLESTFEAYYAESKAKLLEEASIFGISVGGDGATIDKCPLFNAIACSPTNPSMLLDVFDCSQHAADGGKKDAEYIMKIMIPKMKEIDPDKNLIDLVSFDGAGNVQNAAKLLALHFPRITVGPAVEHNVSLVFDKVMRLRPISELCHISKWVSLFVVSMLHQLAHLFIILCTDKKCLGSTKTCSSLTLHSNLESTQQRPPS